VVSDAQSEVLEPGSYTLAAVLPLLMSPTLAKFAAGVEGVIKSQVSFIDQPHQLPFLLILNPCIQAALATELERLNAEILRLDSAPLIPAQVLSCG
jgi:hypothetical protein